MRRTVYTYKHFQLKKYFLPPKKKTNHRNAEAPRWLSPLNTFKQNDFSSNPEDFASPDYFLASAIYPNASLHLSVT